MNKRYENIEEVMEDNNHSSRRLWESAVSLAIRLGCPLGLGNENWLPLARFIMENNHRESLTGRNED